MSATVSDQEPRLAVPEEIARSTKATLERIDRRLDAIENRMIASDNRMIAFQADVDRRFTAFQADVDRRFLTFQSEMNSRLIALQADQRSDFRWLLGVGLGGFGAMFGLIAHAQHWL
jgi:hypothetical protein